MPSRSTDAAGAPVAAEAGTLPGLAFPGAGNGFAKSSGRGNAPATVVKRPKVTVVITHHNYSDFVAGAIDSALGQSYQDVDCIIVDDRSDPQHQRNLRTIFESRRCDRLRLVFNEANIGQIPSFYVGVDNTDADFVCLLDPDDRYLPTFIGEMIEAHLNPYVVAPMACSDQIFTAGGRQLTGVFLKEPQNVVLPQGADQGRRKECTLLFHGCEGRGWPWTSTSSMVFRRSAVELMRPTRELPYKGSADAYFARGAQFLGGTLFLDKALVVREVHARNSWLNDTILSNHQTKYNTTTALHHEADCRADVLISIVENNGGDLFPGEHFVRLLATSFSAAERSAMVETSPCVAQLWSCWGSCEARLAYSRYASNSRTWRQDRGWLIAFGKVLSLALTKAPAVAIKLAFTRLARPFGEDRYIRRRIRYHTRLMEVAGAVSGLFGSSLRP